MTITGFGCRKQKENKGNTKMNLHEAIKVLNEGATDLYKGIFWIVDQDDMDKNRNYCFVIPTNYSGEIVSDTQLNAKSGSTYNHKRTWENLPDAMKHNKPFDYYPRGRVEISNGKALIYLNPNINTEEVKKFIIQEFHLYDINGITMVRTISDGSSHYRCYLDR